MLQARRTRAQNAIQTQANNAKENIEPARVLKRAQQQPMKSAANAPMMSRAKAQQQAVVRAQPESKVELITRAADQVMRKELEGAEREFFCADFYDDVFLYMLAREKKFQVVADQFLDGGEITTKMRGILVDWLVQVHGRFHLMQETLHLTVYILDRMLNTKKVVKDELQLVGITCMMVAAKFEEVFAPDINDYEFITENTFTRKQIVRMELRVLNAVGFELARPHSLTFVRWISREFLLEKGNEGVMQSVHTTAKYLSEIALVDASTSSCLPSRIAMGSLLLAHHLHKVDPLHARDKMKEMTGIESDELAAAVRQLAYIATKSIYQARLVAVRNKFASQKLLNVSKWTPEMTKLAEDIATMREGEDFVVA